MRIDIPSNAKELFENKDAFYSIIDYSKELDNIDSMSVFIEYCGLEEFISENFGTQIILQHVDFLYSICIDAGGMGDFFSHSFEASVIYSSVDV